MGCIEWGEEALAKGEFIRKKGWGRTDTGSLGASSGSNRPSRPEPAVGPS